MTAGDRQHKQEQEQEQEQGQWQAQQSPVQLVEAVLDFIRANLHNIERTWGTDSSQYQATKEIMQKYLDDHVKQIRDRHGISGAGDLAIGHGNGLMKGTGENDIDMNVNMLEMDLRLEDLLAELSLGGSARL